MNSRTINKQKYVSVFAITTLIFISGILLGNHFSNNKISELAEMTERIQLNTLGAELQFLIISKEPCRLLNESDLGNELQSIGSKLEFMENELGTDNKKVLNLKEYYQLLELRHWLLLKQAHEKCNQNFDLIIYFYTNKRECERCREQGGVLTYLRQKNQRLSIYSFDDDIENPAILSIKELYGVKGNMPTLIINEQTYEGFMNSEAIEKALSTKKGINEKQTSNDK